MFCCYYILILFVKFTKERERENEGTMSERKLSTGQCSFVGRGGHGSLNRVQ